MERASGFEKELRDTLVKKTSPGLVALVKLLQKSEDAAKAKRQLLHGGFYAFPRNILEATRCSATFVPCRGTNLVVDFLQSAECRGHGGIGS